MEDVKLHGRASSSGAKSGRQGAWDDSDETFEIVSTDLSDPV